VVPGLAIDTEQDVSPNVTGAGMNRIYRALIDRRVCPHGAFAPNWCSTCIEEVTAEVEAEIAREELEKEVADSAVLTTGR
jgi:hypothetical protein